ncbi:MAG: glycosyltransferase [Planctomycetota bacterium]|nr:MAG: glycosyltransferase [Planctomycetota bacterium]
MPIDPSLTESAPSSGGACARSISIIVPAFNEARRLPETIEHLERFARGRRDVCEIVFVDDGSTDGTRAIIERAIARHDADPHTRVALRLLPFEQNHGKGHAVRAGMLAAAGDVRLMIDADLSPALEEIDRLLPWLARGFDVVIGSRDLPDSRLDPPQPLPRRLAAWAFRAVRRRLLLPELRDTQCGFKLFTAAAARELFAKQIEDGWLFDCEVLALAKRGGFRIKEVGVTWRNAAHSRVRVGREMLRAIPTLLRIRRRARYARR